jgi:ketosteroid isomerase-like protein
MGQLTFSDIQVWSLGTDHALAVGTWALDLSPNHPVVAYHTPNPKDTAGGVFSLVLRRTPDGWKILHDHTSRAEHK